MKNSPLSSPEATSEILKLLHFSVLLRITSTSKYSALTTTSCFTDDALYLRSLYLDRWRLSSLRNTHHPSSCLPPARAEAQSDFLCWHLRLNTACVRAILKYILFTYISVWVCISRCVSLSCLSSSLTISSSTQSANSWKTLVGWVELSTHSFTAVP